MVEPFQYVERAVVYGLDASYRFLQVVQHFFGLETPEENDKGKDNETDIRETDDDFVNEEENAEYYYDADYSVFDNLLYNIDKEDIHFHNLKEIFDYVISFYAANTLLMDNALIINIVNSIALKCEILTPAKYYNTYFKSLHDVMDYESRNMFSNLFDSYNEMETEEGGKEFPPLIDLENIENLEPLETLDGYEEIPQDLPEESKTEE